MDLLQVAVILVAGIVVALFVRWLFFGDAKESEASQLPEDPAILTEIERLRQKPPGPIF
jgi:hypothetical protein